MATDTANLSNVWFKVTDLEVASGEGSWVTTTSGDRYLDFSGGIAVTSTGHSHPHVVQAITDQAKRFIHAQANVYTHDLMQPLAARLTELSPDGIDTFFYANSGAEITEAAVKLAKQATGRPNIIVVQGSFHGRTHQAMAMTTSKNVYRAGHAPLPSGIFATPYPNVHAADVDDEIDRALRALDDMLATMTSPAETAAIIIEPVLGEGGYIAAPARFIEGLDARCKQHGMLFIADEVQSGFGRTGKMFAIEHYDIKPDVICMAKGIASGFPFSALGTRRDLDDRWPTGSHGGTYGGNPIGCAAALATIEILTADGFMDAVNDRGTQLADGLRDLQERHPAIQHVRALGLMIAAQFDTAAHTSAVVQHCLHEGNLITMTAGSAGTTLRFMPPLTVTADEIDHALDALDKALVEIG
ncbi:aspartate aminotransferase family protein [Ilumatobacter sp.]|uniref:aspartate aminotransferase family protein n=1 Tax=Ilumatobacter sp. TaxID=1967498 RepID=UPI003753B184